MIKNGHDFSMVETELTRYKNSSLSQKKVGSWVTKNTLQTVHHWTKTWSQYFWKSTPQTWNQLSNPIHMHRMTHVLDQENDRHSLGLGCQAQPAEN